MTCPGTYPTVLNGQISYNDSSTAEYECLSGFYMTGNKRITCSGGVWQTRPKCHVIEQAHDVFPDWWLIVAAVVLCLLVLICFICVICYFCCGRVVENTIHPTIIRSYGCCGNRTDCYRTGCYGRENGQDPTSVITTPPRTCSDGNLEEQKSTTVKKTPAKEVKGWLPHSHSVRNINTSTK